MNRNGGTRNGATRKGAAGKRGAEGARGRNRTRDIFITSEVLYQLSYSGGRPILGRLAEPLEPRVLPSKYLVNGRTLASGH